MPAWRDVDDERRCLRELASEARQLAGPGLRLRWLSRWVRRVREPVLVFTEYLDTLRATRALLEPARRVTVLHGGQTPAQRALSVEQFTRGPADVLLATDAGSEGLNLHARCRIVVHMDVPWSPRRLAQRNGRLDRIGQSRRVHALLLAIRDTHDVADIERLEARAAVARRAHHGPDTRLAVVASRRRERLATLAVATTTPREAVRQRPVTVARISARRGASLCQRLGIPPRDAAVLAALEVAGAHPMVRPRRWVAFAISHGGRDLGALPRSAAGVAAWAAHVLPAALNMQRAVRRFGRRGAAASARWTALESRARAALPAGPEPDLFLDALQAPAWEPAEPEVATAQCSCTVCLAEVRLLSWRL